MRLQVTRRSTTMKLRLLVSQLTLSLLLFAAPSACMNRFEVVENTEAGVIIGELTFAASEITVPPCPSYVTVEGNNLKTLVKFDREEIVTLNETRNNILQCTATLHGSVAQIQIKILDVNDNVPRFSELEQVHVLNITENFNTPNPVLRLEPVDLDNGTNGTVNFNITAGNEEHFFYIGLPLEYNGPDTNRLELFFNRSADYETHKVFNLTIFLHDHGTPQLNFTQIILIDINDLNDENPTFPMSMFTFEVDENHTVGPEHPFARVEAVDDDSIPSIMVFSLADEDQVPTNAFDYIGLDNETGELYLKASIDYEQDILLHHITFSVQVHEKGMEATVDVASVQINLRNVNEESPMIEIFYHKQSVPENENLASDTFLIFGAEDADGVNVPLLEVDPPLPLLVTRHASTLFRVIINATLDREVLDHATFNITVYDNGTPSLASKHMVDLVVLDENDNPPTFTEGEYNVITVENAPLHHIVATVEATDADFGENGSVSYAVSSVIPNIAEPWFSIDIHTGDIRVVTAPNYTLASSVSIIVTAEDNGTAKTYTTNATTTVNIAVSPSITFKPWSYQEHCLPQNIKLQKTSTKIYVEFRTSKKNGLLLYEQSQEGENFVLGIQDGQIEVLAQNVIQSRFDGFDVSTNDWISVLYDFEKKTLDVSYSDSEEGTVLRKSILGKYIQVRCDDTMDSTSQTFYVGGINAFSHLQNASEYSDFVGTIRNVVIDSTLIDLASPVREENTVQGALFTSEPKCGGMEMTCSGPHFSGCLDYDFESHCICSGGFNSHACTRKENYAPIQLSSSSKVKVAVDYALFVDLLQRSGLVDPTTATPTTKVSSRKKRRRRRSPLSTSNYQLVEFQFRLLRESTGTLLFSKTGSSVHNLEVTKSSQEPSAEHVISYTISDANLPSQVTHVHIAKHFDFVLGDLYTVSINMNTTHVHVSFNGTNATVEWTNVAPFIEYPLTEISIGGADGSKVTSNFTGCISQLSVNSIQFPLNGLVEHNDPSIQIVGESSSSSVSTTCDLCQQERPPCASSFECVSKNDSYVCQCQEGLVPSAEGDQCIEPPTLDRPHGVVTDPEDERLPIYYITGAAAGAVVLIALVVAIFCCICCKLRTQKSQKQTYHVGGDQQLPQLGSGVNQKSRANSYSDVPRRPSMCNSETGYGMVSRHNHDGSSSTTCNDEDTESNIQHMIRSKSSTSGETGFHTASERDDQRSLPRMEDSGNEKDTDYSPFETESDDSQSYVEMESPMSRNMHHGHSKGRPDLNLQQFSSPSGSLGPVSGIGAPLTPKEKTFITPLRPDSRSELGEETDLDTDFSSTVFARQTAQFNRGGYRGGSLKIPGRPDSGMSAYQWYKSSTSSDTEWERKRAEASHAYYPPNPYQSFRRTRATSASSAQQAEAADLVSPLQKCSSLTPPHLKSSSRAKPHAITLPISPLTNLSHRHHQHSISPRPHLLQKERRSSDTSEFSAAAVLSRSQPLKMHPFFRQSSESPRVPAHLTTAHYMPSYMRSFSEESTRKGEKNFVDLGSVRTNCDPIQYWEGQARMMATVDHQVDAFPVLSESFTPFEDSTVESRQSGPQHQSFSSQGGGEATAEAIDAGLLHDCETDSVATGTTLKGSENESRVILFPSADCSEEYRCTPRMMPTVLSQSDSNLLHHSGSVPPSQGTFEV